MVDVFVVGFIETDNVEFEPAEDVAERRDSARSSDANSSGALSIFERALLERECTARTA